MRLFKLIVILSVFVYGIFGRTAWAATQDGILAVVNDDVITLKDFHDHLSMVYMSLTAQGLSPQEIRTIMQDQQTNGLQSLIDDRLMVNAANTRGLLVRQELIDKRIEEIRQQYPTEKEFTADLIRQGLTLSDLKQRLTDQLKARYIEEVEVRSKIFVSPQDVTAYYEANRPDFRLPDSVSLASIFISSDNDPSSAEAKAADLLERLSPEKLAVTNTTFETVAEELSVPVSVDEIRKGEALPEVEKIVFDLQPGEISSPVKVDTGTYVFQLKEKIPGRAQSLDEVKGKISDRLYQKQFRERRQEWLKRLRSEAYIEIK